MAEAAQLAVLEDEQQGQRERDRWVALGVLCTGMLMIVLDTTVVNVALPSIQEDLTFSSQSSLAWVVNAYLIGFGGLLLLSGRLGDLIGRKQIFMIGLTVFTVASLVCGLAQSQEMLIIARFIQGLGGAMTSAVILGMVVTMFPTPAEQARAIGIYAFTASAGGSIGLLVGGALTQAISWHWIFFINLPIGIATFVLATLLLKKDEGIGFGRGADIPGTVLIVSALMLGVYAIVSSSEDGRSATSTLVLGGVAIALLGAFILREALSANPLVPLRIFRSRVVTLANTVQVTMVMGMFGMFFLGALYMQEVLSFDAVEVGFAFLPAALIIGLLSLGTSARLMLRFGPKGILLPGLVFIAIALLLFQRVPVDGHYLTDIFPVMLLFGVGAGLCFPSLMTLAMSGATPSDSGLASGLANTTAQVGGALGLAILATVSTARTKDLISGGESRLVALTDGYHIAFFIGLIAVLAGIVLALFLPGRDRTDTVATDQEAEPVSV